MLCYPVAIPTPSLNAKFILKHPLESIGTAGAPDQPKSDTFKTCLWCEEKALGRTDITGPVQPATAPQYPIQSFGF